MIRSKEGVINLAFNVIRGRSDPHLLTGTDDQNRVFYAVVDDESYNDWKDGKDLTRLATFTETLEPTTEQTSVVWTESPVVEEKLVFAPESAMVNYLYELGSEPRWEILVPSRVGLLRATRLRVSALGLPPDVRENSPELVKAISGALALLNCRVMWAKEGAIPYSEPSRVTVSGASGWYDYNGCQCLYDANGDDQGLHVLKRYKSQFKTEKVMVFVDVSFAVVENPDTADIPDYHTSYASVGLIRFDARSDNEKILALSWVWNRLGEWFFCYKDALSADNIQSPMLSASEQSPFVVMKLGDNDHMY